MKKTVPVRRIDSTLLVPRVIDNYKDVGLLQLLNQLKFGPPLILKGPKGSGKTLAIQQWAAMEGVPFLRQDCTSETTTRDLIGTTSMEGDSVYYQLGSLTTAIDVANEDGGCVLVLEEINTLNPEAQKILNSIADYRQEISIPKIGRIFQVNPKSRIWILGTMNPNYGGTYNINEDFRSRFEFIDVGYMPSTTERDLLMEMFPTAPSVEERRKVQNILDLAKETRGGSMEYALSTRDLAQFIGAYLKLGSWEKSLKLLEGKYEGENVKTFRTRVMSVFKINLDEVKLY